MFLLTGISDDEFEVSLSKDPPRAIALDGGVAYWLYELDESGNETAIISREKIKYLLGASPSLIRGSDDAMSALYLYVYST